MTRTFKYRLNPTKLQAVKMLLWLEACRRLYNAALEQRIEAYRRRRMSLSYFDQCKELTQLRGEDEEYKNIPIRVSRSALHNLNEAFSAFFLRVRRGEKPGYPRFRGYGRYDSFGIEKAKVKDNRVVIPKIGHVRFKKHREMEGTLRDARITFRNNRWWVCISCDLGEAPQKIAVSSSVGVDMGLKNYATLSTGEKVNNPRFFKHGQELLARRQQALSRKRKGSRNRERAKVLVGRAHERIHNQRMDFARKLAARFYERFDLISHEDLNIRGMIVSNDGRLAKSLQDAAWRQFIGALHSKAEYAGKWAVPVEPRGTTARCCKCGKSVPKLLSERTHSCPCGLVLDRDVNAAVNILALGRSVVTREGRRSQC